MLKINLWNTPVEGDFQPYLKFFPVDDRVRPCVLVCPGGGYSMRAAHEGDPVAEAYNAQGFHAAVVEYRVAPARYPKPQQDAIRAIQLLRYHAESWHIRPDRIAILGFSAGGHLAGSVGVLFDKIEVAAEDGADAMDKRPDALVLCYAVLLTHSQFAHEGSAMNLLGDPDYWDMNKRRSVDCVDQISAMTPPAFLWHTADDGCVPVQNSLRFLDRMRQFGHPCEMHIFPHGSHGLGLAPACEDVRQWLLLSADFLKRDVDFR
ncbi:MAG: alpha/beta hydrolase [Victivallaceae bacterium]|nr:alpha/beta hydrolase [Victivallaceae bacterium]